MPGSLARFFMTRLRPGIHRLILLAIAGVGGCASRPAAMSGTKGAATDIAILGPRLDPQATLSLDQIKPVPKLPPPSTQPSDRPPPIDALMLYAKARDAEDSNQRYNAIEYLDQAAKLDPASFDVQSELARLYLSMNAGGEQALDALRLAAQIKPDDLQTQTDLGRVHLVRGELDQAIKHLRLALDTTEYRQDDDSCAITDYYLAQALQKQGYDRAALEEYSRLLDRLQHAPESVRGNPDLDYWLSRPDLLYEEVGRLHEEQGEPEQALAAYQLVSQHSPDDLDTQARIVRLLVEVGRRNEAAHDAVDAVVRTHASPQSLAMLHEVYRGDNASAVAAMRKLYDAHPQDRSVLFALADLLMQSGKPAAAERTLLTVVDQTTDKNGAGDIEVLRKLFGELSGQGKTLDAARLLIETSARRPETVNELLPMWVDLTSLTRRDRLHDEQLLTLPVAKTALAARSYWVARLAVGRPELLKSALDDSLARDPVFAPAFRFALSRIISDDSLKPSQRQQRVDDLVAMARKRSAQGLAQELLATALLANANSAKADGDGNAAGELAVAARTAFSQAEKLGDHSPDLRLHAADTELLLSDSATYERMMWRLLGDRPDDDEAYNTLFRYYEDHGQAERSVAVSQSWLIADPNNTSARLLRILLLSKAGVADEAERMLGELYRERPDDPNVLEMMKAVLAQDHGSSDKYVSILETRVADHPDDLTAVDQLLDEYLLQNRKSDALRLINTARAAVAGDADMLYFTAHLYDRVGEKDSNRDESIKTLEMALKVDPDNAGANNDLGYTFADEGKHLDEAEAMIRHAVDLEPDNAAYLDSLGWVLYKRGKFTDARGYLEKAVEPEDQADPVVLNHLGDDLYRLNADADAQRRWQLATDRLDDEMKRRAAQDDPPDNELVSLKLELENKLRQLKQGGTVDVAPVVETAIKQAHR
jgi:tetratricopeptide (TPR) repeat protein